jgi:hypothetical protein
MPPAERAKTRKGVTKKNSPKASAKKTPKKDVPVADEPHDAAYGFSKFEPLPPDEFDVEPFDNWGGFNDVEYEEVERADDERSCYDEPASSSASVVDTDDDFTPVSSRSSAKKHAPKIAREDDEEGVRKGRSAFKLMNKAVDSLDRIYIVETERQEAKIKKTYATRVTLDEYDDEDSG